MEKIKKNIKDYEIDPHKFWLRVDKSGDCWNWQGAKNTTGYGVYHLRSLPDDYERHGRMMTQLLAHRVAFHLTHSLPDHIEAHCFDYVLHKCDNRICCNPAHLFIGTHQDNMTDMVRKRRK